MGNNKIKKINSAEKAPVKKVGTGISGKVIGLILIALAVVLSVVLICVESGMGNKLTIRNKSSIDISELKIWYEDDNGTITDVMEFTDIAPKEKIVESIKALGLSEIRGQAFMTVRVKFASGGEAQLQSSQILNDFSGRLSLEVSDTSGEEVMLRLKAGEGLFNSSTSTQCDDAYYINPMNGYVE